MQYIIYILQFTMQLIVRKIFADVFEVNISQFFFGEKIINGKLFDYTELRTCKLLIVEKVSR